MQVPPSSATDLFVIAADTDPQAKLLRSHEHILKALVKLGTVTFVAEEPTQELSASAIIGSLKLLIPLPQEFKEKEKLRLVKEKERLIAEQNRLRTQLGNADFVGRAPPALVEQTKNLLLQSEKALEEVNKKL